MRRLSVGSAAVVRGADVDTEVRVLAVAAREAWLQPVGAGIVPAEDLRRSWTTAELTFDHLGVPVSLRGECLVGPRGCVHFLATAAHVREPRQSPRMSLCLPVELDAGGTTRRVVTSDVSATGAHLVLAGEQPPLGARVRVRVELAPGHALDTFATVVRRTPDGIGVHFGTLAPGVREGLLDTILALRQALLDRSVSPASRRA